MKSLRQAALVLNSSRLFFNSLDQKRQSLNQVSRERGIDDETRHIVGSLELSSSENENSHNSAVEEHDNNIPCSMVTIEQIFAIINFVLELPSVVFDQLSSVSKPRYALASMLMAFAILIFCIIELAYIGRKERVTWRCDGRIPWFYHSTPGSKCFGTFPDIVGLVCAIFQCLFNAIAYAFLSQHIDNPIKISILPIIFSFGLLWSKFMKNSESRRISTEIDP